MQGAKGGGYWLWQGDGTQDVIATNAGYLRLPIKSPSGGITYDSYVYSIFFDKAIIPILPTGRDNPGQDQLDNARILAQQELMRDILHNALESWV